MSLTARHRRPAVVLLAALLVAAGLALVGPPAASAAPPFVIDDPGDAVDAVDATPGDGDCETATGTCTLRAAVEEANALGGIVEVQIGPAVDTIELSAGGALEVEPGVDLRLTGRALDESTVTQVRAAGLGDRHFHVRAGARLELVLVQLAEGTTSGDGGAVLNEGELVVTNTADHSGRHVAFVANSADGRGGAVHNTSGASFELRNISTEPEASQVTMVASSAAGNGGSISNDGGTVVVEGSSTPASHDVYIDNGSSDGDGGGVHNDGGGSLTLGCRSYVRFGVAERGGNVFNAATFTGSSGGLDAGDATDGGGLFNDTDARFDVVGHPDCGQTTQVSRSTASSGGGGVTNLGAIHVAATAALGINGNGAVNAEVGGGLHLVDGTVEIDGWVSIEWSGAGLAGGGVAVTGGAIETSGFGSLNVSRNVSNGDGGGMDVSGGSVSGRAFVVENTAAGSGGGLAVGGTGAVDLRKSAVLRNEGSGGGVRMDGGSLRLVNASVGENSSDVPGGGLGVDGGTATLRHVTVVDNLPDGLTADEPVVLQRVLMARNGTANCTGTTPQGDDFNVYDDATCAPSGTDLTDAARFADVGALLEASASGMPRTSFPLVAGNPAIDWVTDAGCGDPDDDQDGGSRPIDGTGDGSSFCDAGALEFPGAAPMGQTVSGTVWDETTRLPLAGVCVYLSEIDGGGQEVVVTGNDGRYTASVPPGSYLVAFYVPRRDVVRDDPCSAGFDMSYQPEWYRNVAVEVLDPDGPDVGPPDMTLVQLVVVDGPVTGIDACLGPGPGAGMDAPCPVAVNNDDPPTEPPTVPVTGGDDADGGNARAAGPGGGAPSPTRPAGPPSELAFVG